MTSVRVRGAIALLVLVLATGCTTDWPVRQFNAGSTSGNSSESTIKSSNVGALAQKWWYRPAAGWGTIRGPLDAGGLVFITEEARINSIYVTHVVALDEQTGKVRWSRYYPRRTWPLAVVNGNLILNLERLYTDAPGQPRYTSMQAVSVTDGTPRWTLASTFDASDFSNVTTGGGRLYARGPQGLMAIAPDTGKLLWASCRATCTGPGDPAFGIAYDSERLYLATLGPQPAGGVLNAATGQPLWSETAPDPTYTWQGPAVAAGRSYLVDTFGSGTSQPDSMAQVAAFPSAGCGRANCPAQWRTLLPDPAQGKPAIAGGRLFVGSAGGLFALDATTGRRLWSSTLAGWAGDPVVAGDVVYVTVADQLLMFPTSGCGTALCRPLRVIQAPSNTPPIVMNGVLVYGDATGVHAYAPNR
jgi:outer membrane protein assembly factor BamB